MAIHTNIVCPLIILFAVQSTDVIYLQLQNIQCYKNSIRFYFLHLKVYLDPSKRHL